MFVSLIEKIQHPTLLVSILVSFCISGFCQEIDTHKYKTWSARDTLQWKDYIFSAFNQPLSYGFQAKAVTSLIYFYRPGIWHADSCMNILVAIRKRHSFTADTTSLMLLKHESIHFDIGELFARYLRKDLLELSQREDYHLDQYLALRDSLFEANHNYQDLYDEETVYGLNIKEQRKWESHIKMELKVWENYTFENMPHLCNECLTKSTSK